MRENDPMAERAFEAEVTRFLDAWMAARQLIQALNFNQFRRAGLSASQFLTLNLLPSGDGGLTLTELARRMNLSPATVAKTVGSLEARGLLTRTRSVTDGRQVRIAITRQGSKLQNAATGAFQRHMSGLFRQLTPAERKGLVEGLETLVRARSDEP